MTIQSNRQPAITAKDCQPVRLKCFTRKVYRFHRICECISFGIYENLNRVIRCSLILMFRPRRQNIDILL